MQQALDCRWDGYGSKAQFVALPRSQWLVTEPNEVGFELIGDDHWRFFF